MLRKALGLSRVYVSLHVAGAGVFRIKTQKGAWGTTKISNLLLFKMLYDS